LKPYIIDYECPACGNKNPNYFTDNGLNEGHPDFTLMCVLPCDVTQSTIDWEYWNENQDQHPICGNQWNPHEEDE
jgi:hypothetical protein